MLTIHVWPDTALDLMESMLTSEYAALDLPEFCSKILFLQEDTRFVFSVKLLNDINKTKLLCSNVVYA